MTLPQTLTGATTIDRNESARAGAVVIGLNEAGTLAACLESVADCGPRVVYVDSDSSDQSIAIAQRAGVEALALDPSRPFSAARARNEGSRRLLHRNPQLEFVQFVDGDVELAPGWIERATRALADEPQRAIVCGRLRERFPDASIYNRLCDIEWDAPLGAVAECGGVFLARRQALQAIGGFDERFRAGEEPELCLRLREAGWRIERLADAMGWHDAGLLHFGDWWRRTKRGGYAYAQTGWVHGGRSGRAGLRSLASIVVWGGVLPALAVLGVPATSGWSLGLLAGYPLLWSRVVRGLRKRGRGGRESRQYAAHLVLGKFAQLGGVGSFALERLRGL